MLVSFASQSRILDIVGTRVLTLLLDPVKGVKIHLAEYRSQI